MALRCILGSGDDALYGELSGRRKDGPVPMLGPELRSTIHNPLADALRDSGYDGPRDFEGFVRRCEEEGDMESI